ncbi:Tetratricopeptide repeat protein 17 [Amphibalanus amphitrite]|uniref:Tetratricopeptide repeat protein 17 n=2 Tax=Amphibalanus amphitrite TaxID=1232801 RepID=A0A6A4XDA0_AMPAM|nr:Tetratricopeptide repeat protein 17 [Amphibalanus amphitrite]
MYACACDFTCHWARMRCVLLLLLTWPWPPPGSWCSTHWVMTEDGRIQAQMDSMFFMKRPYDFIAMAQQERRASMVEALRKELLSHKVEIDQNDDRDQDVEKKLYTEDPHCLVAGQPLTEFDLYPSVAVNLRKYGIRVEDYIDSGQVTGDLVAPDCVAHMKLDYSMLTFQHLVAMKERHLLSMGPELELAELVGRQNVHEFGHRVEMALRRQPSVWVLYQLAGLYWRIQGDAPRAVECSRRAVHLSTRVERFVPLVDLGVVLHRCRHSESGAVVLHAAVDHHDQSPEAHYALGNAYAVLGDYNRSATCFNNTVKLDPKHEGALKRRHAVLCHDRLETALETQHNSLQNTLTELRSYQRQHTLWLQQQEKLLREQAELETKIESRLNYEEQKIRESADGKGHTCFRYYQNGQSILSCNMASARGEPGSETVSDLQTKLSDLQNKADRLEEQVSKLSRGSDSSSEEDGGEEEEDGNGDGEDALARRYTALDPQATAHLQEPDWPSQEECGQKVTKFPSANEFPSVFLAPDNKGFDVDHYLNEGIGVPVTEDHALPWYRPACQPVAARVLPYDTLETVRGRARLGSRPPDPVALEALMEYARGRQTVEAELGQRINAALRQATAPSWVLETLASLYWRAQGSPAHAIECLRSALHAVPAGLSDVPLTSLAALLYRLDDVDGALKVARQAHNVDTIEPDTNFLLGNLLAAKGNFTGAVWHYLRTLQAEPDHRPALQYLRVVSCYTRYHGHQRAGEQQCQTPAQTPAERDPIMEKLSKMPADSVVCTSECADGLASESCDSKISCYNARSENGRWILTPALADQLDCAGGDGAELSAGHFIQPPPAELSPLPADDQMRCDRLLTPPDGPPPADSPPDSSDSEYELEEQLDVLTEPVPERDERGIVDDPLPDVLLRVRERAAAPPPSREQCADIKQINWGQYTSTWLSVSAKNVVVELVPAPVGVYQPRQPVCPDQFPASMATLDNLSGVRHRRQLLISPETGLREALQTLTADQPRTVEETATRIAMSMDKNSSSWVLTTAAALYWRVRGDGPRAASCLRIALHHAPRHLKDIPLISLANILHRAGLYNDALIVCNMALEISPKFVVIHFTMANIYAAKGDLEKAVSFYQSTLALQASFEPAKERLRAIQCSLQAWQDARQEPHEL